LVLLRHDFGSASDVLTIHNGQFANVLFRVRDARTTSGTSIGEIYLGSRIYDQSNPTLRQFDLGNYGLGATYGDSLANTVILNNSGSVGNGQGSIVMAKSSDFYVTQQTTKQFRVDVNGNVCIFQMSAGTSATRTYVQGSGTAPTTSPTDAFQMYSADIVAGNAAPHFRVENGDIVKIYSIGGWGTPSGTLTRTTFDPATVTLPDLAQRVAALITDLKTGHQLIKRNANSRLINTTSRIA
jgi:hypothetical protein